MEDIKLYSNKSSLLQEKPMLHSFMMNSRLLSLQIEDPQLEPQATTGKEVEEIRFNLGKPDHVTQIGC